MSGLRSPNGEGGEPVIKLFAILALVAGAVLEVLGVNGCCGVSGNLGAAVAVALWAVAVFSNREEKGR